MAAVLLDTCVWGGVAPQLAELGHEVDWSGNWPKDPGDHMILGIAHSQNRILITLDKDFGELAILKGMKEVCDILERLVQDGILSQWEKWSAALGLTP